MIYLTLKVASDVQQLCHTRYTQAGVRCCHDDVLTPWGQPNISSSWFPWFETALETAFDGFWSMGRASVAEMWNSICCDAVRECTNGAFLWLAQTVRGQVETSVAAVNGAADLSKMHGLVLTVHTALPFRYYTAVHVCIAYVVFFKKCVCSQITDRVVCFALFVLVLGLCFWYSICGLESN